MAGRERKLTLILAGDASGAARAMDTIDRKSGTLGSKIGGLAKSAAIGFAGLAAGAAAFGKVAVDAASDLEESMSKVNVVFKEGAGDVVEWSKTAATAMGMSQQAALEAAGTFGNFLIAMGNPADAAQEMSKGLVGLASDLASFNNANPEDVLLALRSGLSGEAEPLRKFGVSLSAARIEAEGMSVGINKAYNEMTAAEKSTLAYQVILKDTSMAQGDFARTSGGLANKQRILSAKWKDMQAKIGRGLIPVMGALVGIAEKLIPVFEKVGGVVSSFFGAFRNSKDGVTQMSGLGHAAEVMGINARKAFDTIISKVRELWPDIKAAFEKIQATILEVWPKVQRAFGDVLAKVREVWPQIQQTITSVIEIVATAISGLVDDFSTYLLPAMTAVATFVVDELVPKIAAFTNWIADNEGVIKAFGTLIGVWLVGHYTKLAVEATVSAAKQAAAWVLTKTQAIAAAVTHAAQIALMIGKWALLALKAGVHAAVVVGSWVATNVAAATSSAAHAVAVAAQTGGWSALAASATANSARIASAWLAALGPAAAVIAAAETINGMVGSAKGDPNADKSLLERLNPFSAFEGMSVETGEGVPFVPGIASGGIVRARPGGLLANIAEGGYDEAVIPLDGRHGLGGNNYRITVNVPPSSDPAAVGRSIVEMVSAYERRSGTGWRAS